MASTSTRVRIVCPWLIAALLLVGPARAQQPDVGSQGIPPEAGSSGVGASGTGSSGVGATDDAQVEDEGIGDKIAAVVDGAAGVVVGYMATVLFYDPVRPFAVRGLEGVDEQSVKAALSRVEAIAKAPGDELSELEKAEVSDILEGLRSEHGRQALPYVETARAGLAPAEGETQAARAAYVSEELAKLEPRLYTQVRLVVLWLIFGAVTFTLLMRFINLRAMKHAVDVIAGKFDNPKDHGEVSHFQALCAALSATVGLGNIAGVSAAVILGGPGAIFWMVVSAVFGMTSKFVECTLGQKYRRIDEHGRVSGGAMHYLERGLTEMGLKPLGKLLAFLFAILCIGGSFGGGNMFQANQSFEAIHTAFGLAEESKGFYAAIYGVVLAVLVGLVIIGGIKRIAATAGKIVPLMCGVYVVGCLYILLSNFSEIPAAFGTIISSAFAPKAVGGGFFGVLVIGVQRAAFSNEAGIGSAAIAHSAAKTEEPVREGIVALLEPFIDTVIVCTMTGLTVVITGAYQLPEFQTSGVSGSAVTSRAFESAASWFPLVLAAATVLFAYSTMISWSYYGERCWTFLFGDWSTIVYKLVFIAFIFVGAVTNLGNVLDFSDMMILGMAFPNLLGCLLLSGKVRRDLAEYWRKLRAGEFKRYG